MPGPDPAERAAVAPVEISPSMRLLLAAALQPRDQAAEAWAEWLETVDFEALEHGATALLALVARNLPELDAEPSIEGRVRGVQRQAWAANQVQWSAARPSVERLAGLPGSPLVLPPTSLVPAFGGAWGARPWYRIEVGLHPATCAEVRAVLADNGWPVDHLTPRRLAWTEAGLVDRWEVHDAADNGISIRWKLLRGIASEAAGEQLRASAIHTTIGAVPVRILHPADSLVERLWNAPAEQGPGWIVEVVVVARQLAVDQPDVGVAATGGVGRFSSRARALGVSAVLRQRLDRVAAVVDDPTVAAARAALDAGIRHPAERLWDLPGPVAGLGRSWASHAAGQGVLAGARSMVRLRRSVARVR